MKQTIFNSESLKPFSDINLTPMLDTVFTILIIFIIIAPIMEQGLDVRLPSSTYNRMSAKQSQTLITINKDNKIFIESTLVPADKLGYFLTELGKKSPSVILKADRSLSFQYVVYVLDQLRLAGITNISIATEPKR